MRKFNIFLNNSSDNKWKDELMNFIGDRYILSDSIELSDLGIIYYGVEDIKSERFDIIADMINKSYEIKSTDLISLILYIPTDGMTETNIKSANLVKSSIEGISNRCIVYVGNRDIKKLSDNLMYLYSALNQ